VDFSALISLRTRTHEGSNVTRSLEARWIADFEHKIERGNGPHSTDLLKINCLWIVLGDQAADRAIQRLDPSVNSAIAATFWAIISRIDSGTSLSTNL
jgi:hypothetical protein